jgi:hypothetical protein
MATLIEGIDYKTRYTTLIDNTFDTDVRQEFEPLWYIIDYYIDKQARDNKNLYCDADYNYRAVEDFCIYKNNVRIPPLYKTLFDVKQGFLSQVKFPLVITVEWIEKFPQPIQVRNLTKETLIQEFRSFLLQNEDKYWNMLVDLEPFGFEYDVKD